MSKNQIREGKNVVVKSSVVAVFLKKERASVQRNLVGKTRLVRGVNRGRASVLFGSRIVNIPAKHLSRS